MSKNTIDTVKEFLLGPIIFILCLLHAGMHDPSLYVSESDKMVAGIWQTASVGIGTLFMVGLTALQTYGLINKKSYPIANKPVGISFIWGCGAVSTLSVLIVLSYALFLELGTLGVIYAVGVAGSAWLYRWLGDKEEHAKISEEAKETPAALRRLEVERDAEKVHSGQDPDSF